jgi:UDP-N-acetylmuramoylalanine--D-glutamate ligase
MIDNLNLRNKTFAIYGLGVTGISTLNYLKRSQVKKIEIWDDNISLRKEIIKKFKLKEFSNSINKADYIIISPGINIQKSKFKKILLRNKNRIITDIDLFFLSKVSIKTIVVTGTNGKSTTCKLIEHLLKKNNKKVFLGGNIGKPILDLNIKKNSIIIVEASSFQLSYSKFIKPDYALMLNIAKDHLDWQGGMKNYLKSKFNIFLKQDKKNFALIGDKKLSNIFIKNKYLGKLKFVPLTNLKKIEKKISNPYLLTGPNKENISFVYMLSKLLKIKKNIFLKSINSFKGLPHRYEIFYKKKKITFINDSKATSFESTKFALNDNKNIFWILGGLPKYGDTFKLKNLNKNIIKAFIIGRNTNYYERILKNKINFSISKTLKKSLIQILKEIKKIKNQKSIVLLSPASASYDQFKNFEERGNQFKKLVKIYAPKYI